MSQNTTPKTHSSKSRVWAYFKQCDGDPSKARCNLCSAELCNRGTTSVLWNHVKFKHSIGRHTTTHEEDQESPSESNMTPTKLKTNNTKNLRQTNLDFIDYNDLTLTSMKPLPSSSLSRNLISRLNQLSSPVTRKLKFWNKKSFQVNQYDPSFKVIYLGNLGMQLWSKDESCLDKPLSTLWNNYLVNMKTEIVMRLTICNSGLKAITRQHGLTQYWSNRLVYCCSHKNHPRIFSWVYRHEGKKMRQELRCHAVLCPSPEKAAKMVTMLNQRLVCALQEFRREKKSRGPCLVSNNNLSSLQQKLQPRTIPLRRQILAKGAANFRPPLERSKSAPKLTSILEEDYDLDDEQESQEEFEYEESFGDSKEDSDYDVEEEEEIESQLAREDEDSTQKTESNSLATTANEETSNSSGVCATGDSSYDNKQKLSNQLDKNNGGIIPKPPVEQFNRCEISSGGDAYQSKDDEHKSRTKETIDYSSNDKMNMSHRNLENQRSSANINNTSSSFQEQMVANNSAKSNDKSSLMIIGAKNNNTSNKKEPQPAGPADDVSQEIILSWSNLVIR